MTNINNNELDIVSKFFQDYTGSVERILSQKFDESVFDKIVFSVKSVTSFNNIKEIFETKESNVLYRFSYLIAGAKGTCSIAIPEEFIAIASDLLMGGDAKEAYSGSLTELEINASLNLFNSILDDTKITFKSLYSKDLAISSEPEVIVKTSPKYSEILDNSGFDLAIKHSLKLGQEKEFGINFLTNAGRVKQALINIDVLDEPIVQNIQTPKIIHKELDGFADISNISDIKINIEAELGRIKIPIKNVLGLVGGSIIELDTYDNSDIKVFANGLEVAKAQVVVVDDCFGIKITKIISPEERCKEI